MSVFVTNSKDDAKAPTGVCWGPFDSDDSAKQFVANHAVPGVYYFHDAATKTCFEKPAPVLTQREV